MDIDVIILSYTKNDSIFNMNIECIDSINKSSEQHNFNIFIVETEKEQKFFYPYDNVKVIQPESDFNYNKFINVGLQYCKNDWILISNNDTVYHKNSIDALLRAHSIDNELLSLSPIDDTWFRHNHFDRNNLMHYGYRTSFEITGWSILMNKKVIEIIGNFDEQFAFWYQDNDYANNLKKYNIKHALISNSQVTHKLSSSYSLIEKDKFNEFTNGALKVFSDKWSGGH